MSAVSVDEAALQTLITAAQHFINDIGGMEISLSTAFYHFYNTSQDTNTQGLVDTYNDVFNHIDIAVGKAIELLGGLRQLQKDVQGEESATFDGGGTTANCAQAPFCPLPQETCRA
jgi:hypothetical protein